MKDSCVICGAETKYDEFEHIDLRYFYVEGAGQLCPDCYSDTLRESVSESFSPIEDHNLKQKILNILEEIHNNRSQINFDSFSVRQSIASQIAKGIQKQKINIIT
tara:strand:- start:174 stop:488 length:315 start_codon:yes stop_codon:yes gene_type:complete